MAEYKIAIVGSGPAGLSAAARAAAVGMSHVLLEATDHLSDTIFKYQKGKHVMAEPDILPLRSPLDFAAGKRETILTTWDKQINALAVNVQKKAEVKTLTGRRGDFTLTLHSGEVITAECVILSIGLQGNLRKLGCEGEELPLVQYTLPDPDELRDESILVVGAGDAAIENALALAENNAVTLVNRKDEFNRAKQGNLDLINKAIKEGKLDCAYNSTVARVLSLPQPLENGEVATAVLNTPSGESEFTCHRIIARLGATPPRKFVESCGIEFPNNDPAAVPALSPQYESNVAGLYIVGALAGYPLIKQAMNQGYEVVETIAGNPVEPVDEPLLQAKFSCLAEKFQQTSVDFYLQLIQDNVPLLAGITTLQLREFLLDSTVSHPAAGEVVFHKGDYTNTFFSIVAGEVKIQIDPDNAEQLIRVGQGNFFGEMGLISGRRRTATVLAGEGCVLLETPRRSMNKLISSVESVKQAIDRVFLLRAVQGSIAPHTPVSKLQNLLATATLQTFKAGEVLFREGDDGDKLYLVRKGSLTVSHQVAGKEKVFSYLPAGNYVGEMALLGKCKRTATITAAVETETICLDGEQFMQLIQDDDELRQQVEEKYQQRLAQNVKTESSHTDSGSMIAFLVSQGLGEATDVLLIDTALCVRCNNCETACAETHGGTSRLNREAGKSFATLHVPTSCRHCEHPHCMSDCPPDAIKRSPNGEVYISDNCIGCGNCERNCPYGVIQMAAVGEQQKPGLLSWLLFNAGPGPGENKNSTKKLDAQTVKKAVKCDVCKDIPTGPSCVSACPTGAAMRVNPAEFMSVATVDPTAVEQDSSVSRGRSILFYRRCRYLKLSALLMLVSLLAYCWHNPIGGANGGTWLGYTLGGIALALIFWLMYFGIRKRHYKRTVGKMQAWLSAHVYLGLSLIVVATLHAAFTVAWNVHTLAYVLMLLVIASGIFGVVAYARCPTLMTQNRAGKTLSMLLSEIADIDQAARDAASQLSDAINKAIQDSCENSYVGGSVWQQLAASAQQCATRRAYQTIQELAKQVSADDAAAARNLVVLIGKKLELLQKARQEVRYKAIMDIWLYFHVPLSFALLAALIAHVVAVFFYW